MSVSTASQMIPPVAVGPRIGGRIHPARNQGFGKALRDASGAGATTANKGDSESEATLRVGKAESSLRLSSKKEGRHPRSRQAPSHATVLALPRPAPAKCSQEAGGATTSSTMARGRPSPAELETTQKSAKRETISHSVAGLQPDEASVGQAEIAGQLKPVSASAVLQSSLPSVEPEAIVSTATADIAPKPASKALGGKAVEPTTRPHEHAAADKPASAGKHMASENTLARSEGKEPALVEPGGNSTMASEPDHSPEPDQPRDSADHAPLDATPADTAIAPKPMEAAAAAIAASAELSAAVVLVQDPTADDHFAEFPESSLVTRERSPQTKVDHKEALPASPAAAGSRAEVADAPSNSAAGLSATRASLESSHNPDGTPLPGASRQQQGVNAVAADVPNGSTAPHLAVAPPASGTADSLPASLHGMTSPTAPQPPEALSELTPRWQEAMRSQEALQPALRGEVHVALHNDWGQVDIRARWIEGGLGATITVDRGDIGSSLANQLPSLQRSLEQHNLPVHGLTLEGGGSASSGRDPQHANQQHAPPHVAPWFAREVSDAATEEPQGTLERVRGLSVHA